MNGAANEPAMASIPTLTASQAEDQFTSYSALQTQWPQDAAAQQHQQHAYQAQQSGYSQYEQTPGQGQFLQDGEYSEVQL